MYEKKGKLPYFKKEYSKHIQYNNMYLFQMHMIRFISFFCLPCIPRLLYDKDVNIMTIDAQKG